MSVSPPLGYWNLGAVSPHKEANRYFTDPNVTFLGTRANQAQRFGVELTLAIYNAMIHSGLRWEDPEEFLQRISYLDEDSCWKNLQGFGQFHPTRNAEEIQHWLGYWKWHEQVTAEYLIFITKKQLRDHRPSPTHTVISPALFGVLQDPAELIIEPNQESNLVEAVLGMSGTADRGVCFFGAYHIRC